MHLHHPHVPSNANARSLAVFSLNEPDLNGISAASAADWYKQHINPLAIKKAFPAITSSTNSGMGLDWLQNFLNSCGGGCYGDYINLVRRTRL